MKRSLFLLMVALLVLAPSCCRKRHKPDNVVTPRPEAVDMGVVVDGKKVLWASFNLGASNENELGDYYAWGEVITYYSSLDPLQWRKRNPADENELRYDWGSYIYAHGAGDKLTKYCVNSYYWDGEGIMDNKIKLDLEDDAAHVNLGGKWRIPSVADFKALSDLRKNEDYQWSIDKAGLHISRISTGASLFFPVAGTFSSEGYGAVYTARYWLSETAPDLCDEAKCIGFSQYTSLDDDLTEGCCPRFLGFSIRPVMYEE